ncbi:MAG: alcohol dehydrogenase catalytic domain-containing protein [Verrucomicrobiota bacterium]
MSDPLPKEMRAVVYRGPNDLRLETLPVPEIGPDELLVKVAVCGVCPTDIKKIQYGTVPPPRVFGHETAGLIVRTGSRVTGFQLGERVALHHHVPCLVCHFCQHRAFAQCADYKRTGITAGFEPAGGGYAEYVRVMPFVLPGVVRIPDDNSYLEGALLEPVNTVLKAVKRLSLFSGDSCLVIGQGPVGLMFTRLLALQGVRVAASDLLETKLVLAKQFGAEWTIAGTLETRLAELAGIAAEGGFDAVVVAVPVDSVLQPSLQLLRGGGKLLLFAHTRRGAATPLDLAAICVDEKDVIGSYSADFTLQDEVAQLVFSRQIDVETLVSHEFALEQTADAIQLASRPQPDSLKVVVRVDVSAWEQDSCGGRTAASGIGQFRSKNCSKKH